MPRPKLKRTLNLDDRDTKRRLMTFVGQLNGFYEIDMQPKRSTRSLNQNAYYWSAIVQPFYEYLAEQDFDVTSPEDAHEFLRARFLGDETIRSRKTGKVLCKRRVSTSTLTTEAFGEYLEKCRALLAQYCNFEVPDPDPNWRNTPCTSSS